jgi:hypothetical protein
VTPCINVKADPYSNGYGRVCRRVDGKSKTHLAHRWYYEQAYGTIPEGLVIRHKCDNRTWVNVDHLETGTAFDNQQDSINRGRMAGMKLTLEDVKAIRSSTESQRKLAVLYGISQPRVSAVKRGISYRTMEIVT